MKTQTDANPAALHAPVEICPGQHDRQGADFAGRDVVLRGLQGVDVPAHYVDVGSGRPFVFLHGLVGMNEHWEEVVRRVCHRVRCVMLQIPLLDLEGDDCSIHGVEVLTARFLEHHFRRPDGTPEPAVLVGNSFGGHVALRLALEHAHTTLGLVLAGSSGLIEKSMVSDVQIRPSREWLQRKIGELFYDQKNMNPADVERAYGELSRRNGARAMVKLSRSARRNHLGSRLGQIRQPTLLIWGRQDIVTPPEAAEGFRQAIPRSQLVWFERCGHAPMLEAPERFAQAILDFDAQLDPGR